MVCVDGRKPPIDLYPVKAPQRAVRVSPEPIGVVIANHGIDTSRKIVVRLFSDDVYGAADRIPAIDRALRATKHFDALHIVEFGIDRSASLQRHAIDAISHG